MFLSVFVHTFVNTVDEACDVIPVLAQVGQISAKEIIDEFLTLEIKVALQSTNLSLKEIADRYNFPDQSFFGRYFKKHTGMSPKEYRAKRI